MKNLTTLRNKRRLIMVELLKKGIFTNSKIKASEINEITEDIKSSRISKMNINKSSADDFNLLKLLLFRKTPIGKQNKINLVFKFQDSNNIVKKLQNEMDIAGNHLSELIEDIYLDINSIKIVDDEVIRNIEIFCKITTNTILKYSKHKNLSNLVNSINFDSQLSSLELFYNNIPKIVLKDKSCKIKNISLICNLDSVQTKYLYPFYIGKRQEFYNPCVDVSDLEFLEAFVEFDNGLGKFFIIEFNKDYYVNRYDLGLKIDSINSPLIKIELNRI